MDPLELELQMVPVTIWGLGMEPGSSTRAASALNRLATTLVLLLFFLEIKVSYVGSPGYPKLRDPSASVFQVLPFKVTRPSGCGGSHLLAPVL